MVVSAILVLGESPSPSLSLLQNQTRKSAPESSECLAGRPIICFDLLGQSILQRTIDYLHGVGVKHISLACKSSWLDFVHPIVSRSAQLALVDHRANPWFASQRAFADYRHHGVQTVLLIRLGAYVEFDFADLMRFHRDQRGAVTLLSDAKGPLEFMLVDTASYTAEGIGLTGNISATGYSLNLYKHLRYANRLVDVYDIRTFVVDAFLSRSSVRPAGKEMKPGIWMGDNAEVHRLARIVAPAYIGAETEIHAAALITKCSHVERGSRVDCRTVVESSSILPGTYVGPWLEVSGAVVWDGSVTHLQHNITVAINDARLIGKTTSSLRTPSGKRRSVDEEWMSSNGI